MKYVPPKYDDNKLLELPLLHEGISMPYGMRMEGMNKHFDNHSWCKTMTFNIKNNFGL